MEIYERIYAEIDLNAFASNIKEIKNKVGEGVKILSVVKADGYGHGAYEVAVTALSAGASALCVAILEEATELRKKGIKAPIVIIGACYAKDIKTVIDYDLEQTVFYKEAASEINQAAKEMGKKAKILIKIDTGMGRIGFLPCKQAIDDITEIFCMEYIEITGMFSHLSCSDSEDKAYSHMQNSKFNKVIDCLRAKGLKIPPLHISNSGAVMSLPGMNYDCVRPGIMQYGFNPLSYSKNVNFNLLPVMSIKSCITFIKSIRKGECVGYSASYTANRDMAVATIPVGYADGYSRKMKNGGRVIINGEFAPIIGSICMDQFMVDVTGINNIKIGDIAVLMGKQGTKEITAYEIAEICETIVYEVVCSVSKRVPRLYFINGKIYKAGQL